MQSRPELRQVLRVTKNAKGVASWSLWQSTAEARPKSAQQGQ